MITKGNVLGNWESMSVELVFEPNLEVSWVGVCLLRKDLWCSGKTVQRAE